MLHPSLGFVLLKIWPNFGITLQRKATTFDCSLNQKCKTKVTYLSSIISTCVKTRLSINLNCVNLLTKGTKLGKQFKIDQQNALFENRVLAMCVY